MAYRIKNWEKFQHYKKRNPPWIKLHFEMLSSQDWVMLDDASRLLAIACMLIASRNDGLICDNLAYIQRVAYLNNEPNLKPLIDSGFLVYASKSKRMLADASVSLRETETETETERETEGARTPSFEEVEEYCKERGNSVKAAVFFEYYGARGWLLGGAPVRDWKALVREWEARESKPPKKEEVIR